MSDALPLFQAQAPEHLPGCTCAKCARVKACGRGEHQRHALWSWRCEHCGKVLCTRCGLELDECTHPAQHLFMPREVANG